MRLARRRPACAPLPRSAHAGSRRRPAGRRPSFFCRGRAPRQVATRSRLWRSKGLSKRLTWPESGMVMPIIMRMELVLPAPFGPAAEDLAGVDGKAEVADGNLVLVGLGHSREFDNWHGFSRRAILSLVQTGSRKNRGPPCKECSKTHCADGAYCRIRRKPQKGSGALKCALATGSSVFSAATPV